MENGKTLILIDGHALAFRQYYALERTNMKTTNGTPTWAVFGFFKAIFDLLKNPELKADAIAVAFDVSHNTFRTEKYEDYKSNRVAMPDPMRVQMDIIYDGLKAFNIPIYTKEGFEADDVIGTISKEACELGHRVLILTGDQDAFQLVDPEGCIKVIIPGKGELVEYNWNKIYEKLGVYPNQVIDYKALRGDTSDCIPGIKGIGEKTAQKLLDRYKTLDEVLKHCEEIPEKAVRERVCNGKDDAELSRFLATIVRDLDINFDFENTVVELPDIAKVTEFLTKMQFYSFIKNINEILNSFNKNNTAEFPSEISASNNNTADGQLQLFSQAVSAEINKKEAEYSKHLITDSQDFDILIKKIKTYPAISIEIKADIKSVISNIITGIGIALNKDFKYENNTLTAEDKEKSEAYYIPLINTSLTQKLPTEYVLEMLKPVFEDENIKKTCYDCKNIYNILRPHGIQLKGIQFDIMLASYIKNPSRNHELQVQSIEHISHAICEYAPYEKNKKKQIKIQDAPIENVLNYVTDEIATITDLTKFWIKELDKDETRILYEIEIPLAKVLSEMEYNGVSIDVEYLRKLSNNMTNTLHKLERRIYDLADCGFNINSPKQVGEILFDKLGLKSKKKRGRAQYSTSAEVLEELAPDYEIARQLLDYRKYAKLKSTYTDALPALIDTDGRIHTTYNQTITATGRLSSSNPNLQNIPVRTEEGSKLRAAFVPENKHKSVILSADYSQIELRLLAHISEDKHLIEAFKSGTDVHTLTASKVFEVPLEEVTKEMRYKAKAVNFGIIYGQSKYGLAKALGISNSEAEQFIDKYFATYPKIKAYMEATVKQAEIDGFVETIFGRKRYLKDELESPNNMIREFAKRAAINQPMQGTAADLIKIAMIDFAQKLKENNLKSKLILQVHDELVVETLKEELDTVKKLVKKSMELNQPLRVPLVVDISTGDTWKES
ncbi:DNA polymerase I [Spirochaetes bacterium]|uniref:DNA polymerase I n=1 Tax=Candidatus Scatousia excrementipullorum TaxID=2840936 RepID=A0A9D9DN58_9BACT|nr:DNA polymerase I [Candidatus Scatousia excrementipullorum]